MNMHQDAILNTDNQHIWHPYASMTDRHSIFAVESASGVRLKLTDGRELIDGMASWWCMIHGYNHPEMNRAIKAQLDNMSHVMFGGLTHAPAAQLARSLVDITPGPLQHVFFSDSGSVAVEIAIKMAIQYWYSAGNPKKNKLLTIRSGYHGDTFGAMSVCDPVTGMHQLFTGVMQQQYFADEPRCTFDEPWDESDIESFKALIADNYQHIAAVILEPIVQGAGGMRFYSPHYLKRVRKLCDEYGVLLIADEIATGFGRSGKLFACEHAGITPDIMCVGKALTGGYMSLAATLTTQQVGETIGSGEPGIFMHGPTFMGNPLACSAAVESIRLLLESPWQKRVENIEQILKTHLPPAAEFPHVSDVRILGAIGVVETVRPVKMREITKAFVSKGVWLRPFGNRIYMMPPYVINNTDLEYLANTLVNVVSDPSMLED